MEKPPDLSALIPFPMQNRDGTYTLKEGQVAAVLSMIVYIDDQYRLCGQDQPNGSLRIYRRFK